MGRLNRSWIRFNWWWKRRVMSSSGTSFKRVKPHRFPKRRRLRASPRITWMEVNQLNPFEQNNRQKWLSETGRRGGEGEGWTVTSWRVTSFNRVKLHWFKNEKNGVIQKRRVGLLSSKSIKINPFNPFYLWKEKLRGKVDCGGVVIVVVEWDVI